MIRNLVKKLSCIVRAKRAQIFLRYLKPEDNDKILDLGSENGSNIASIIPYRKNVYLADICKKSLENGKAKYGFKTVLLPENGRLPIENRAFDIVYCTSVIEHVTGIKNDVYIKDGRKFREMAFKHQRQFADEIRRIAKNYFIQTPNKCFFIETHTWLPFINFFPRHIMMWLIIITNKFWIKHTSPDWNLLSEKEMKELFPDAEIVKEKFLFMTKSIMAIKSDRS